MIGEIEGFEGRYFISSAGEVFSMLTKQRKSTEIAANGYERVSLWKDGEGKHFLIHRLVALAFIPNPNGYEMVNHIDGNKLNNNVENLERCNASRNMKHAYENHLITPKTTKVMQYTKDFKLVRIWESIAQACEALKLNHANISTVCRQNTNRKYAGGYIWRYADAKEL